MVTDNLENMRILITLRRVAVGIWTGVVRIDFCDALSTDWAKIGEERRNEDYGLPFQEVYQLRKHHRELCSS